MAFCVAGAPFAGVGIWTQRKRSARAGRHDKPQLARTATLAHTRGASRGWPTPHDAAGLRVAWLRHCPFCVRAGVFQEQTNSHYLSGRPNTTHSNGSLARARSPRLHRSSLLTPRDTLFEQFSRAPSKHVCPGLIFRANPERVQCTRGCNTPAHFILANECNKHPCFPRKTSVP